MKTNWMTQKFHKYSPTILTCLGVAGVIGTTVLAVKATPKAVDLINQAKEEKGEDLTKLEIIDVAAPVYIPSALVGTATIACILGANILNKRSQASLISAYALLDKSYKNYTQKTEELYGEEADAQIKEEVAKDNYVEGIVVPKEEELFFDFRTLQYFHATMDEVVQKVEMEDGMECYIVNTPFDPPTDLY